MKFSPNSLEMSFVSMNTRWQTSQKPFNFYSLCYCYTLLSIFGIYKAP